jgi:tetratricopeptide (TPR) repeat protein
LATHPEQLLAAATQALASNDLEGVERCARGALQEDPRIAEAHNLLAIAAHKSGRSAAALAAMTEAARLEPENLRYLTNLGELQRTAGEIQSAKKTFERALSLEPNDVSALNALGLAHAAEGEFEKACRLYRKALAADRNFPRAYNNLGSALSSMKLYDEAIEVFEQGLRLKPDYAVLLINMAEALASAGRSEEADQRRRQARQILDAQDRGGLQGPDNSANALGNRAQRHMKLGEHEEARRCYERAIARAPNNRNYYFGLSAALAATGRIESAKDVTRQTIERYPSYTRVAENAEARVLVLEALYEGYFTNPTTDAAAYAQSNTITQLECDRLTFHHLLLNHSDPLAVAKRLGPIDVIFNNAANAELNEALGITQGVEALSRELGCRLLNPPSNVNLTTRATNAARLGGIAGLRVPKAIEVSTGNQEVEETADLIEEEIGYPVMVRHAHHHASENILRLRDRGALLEELRNLRGIPLLAQQYVDLRRPDGYHSRLRAVFVEGEFFPSVFSIETNWIVRGHGKLEAMKDNEALRAEERQWLEDPEGYIGAGAIAALQEIANRLDLDFLGVDFSPDQQGEIVFFEANACMACLADPRILRMFPYREPSDRRLRDRLEQLLLDHGRKDELSI